MSEFVFRGEAERPAWSGSWWPMPTSAERPAHRSLYDDDGPLDKYDQHCVALGLPNPRSREFERWRYWSDTRTEQATGYKAFFWGHCNGWAAAAVLEVEPTRPQALKGLLFTVGDQKGLLTVCHNGDPVDLIRKLGPNDAHLFHSMVLQSIGKDARGLVFDTKLDAVDPKTSQPVREVWNYPAYRYECTYAEVAADTYDVVMRLWLADDSVAPDFVGTQNWPAPGQPKTYTYRIAGDKVNPRSGAWTGASQNDHPDLMWRPQPLAVQSAAEERDPGSSQTHFHPTLRSLVYGIIAGAAGLPGERAKLAGRELSWVITADELAAYPPPLAVGDWWRYLVAHRDANDHWTRPFVLHVEVVGDKGGDWVFAVGAVHQGDRIPERHVLHFRKQTRALSPSAPFPGGYAYTLHQDATTGALSRRDAPSLWQNSPLRRLLSQVPYAWERAGQEPVDKVTLPALGRAPIPCRTLPVGLGSQAWADYTVRSPRGNLRGMFLIAQFDLIQADLCDLGHKEAL